ncbi:tail fiber domain-containing protein [Paraburkholderia sp. J8-2]|uniref:tail fiber domain-containing protein n=1 Tax=Paraburkholderia sp. J8-2 TaxID=2805440 RepID=UPI002AB729D7|nr:tail fiber domain-containing protein [Paraburkholderia sp. J8-2]
MSALQQIDLGVEPTGVGGDTFRGVGKKLQSNIGVLSTQAALTSAVAVTDPGSALTVADHVGRRVNIALTASGAVKLPASTDAGADAVILLRNTGTVAAYLAAADGSGDSVGLVVLNPGDGALVDADGAVGWGVLLRSVSDTAAVIDSPTLTGVPTVPTAALGTDTGQAASTAFVQAAIAAVIDGAPGALNTLKELADALGDNANYAATVTNALTLKADTSYVDTSISAATEAANDRIYSGDTAVTAAANDRMDSGDTATLAAAKQYTNTTTAQTLAAAQQYTDEQVVAAIEGVTGAGFSDDAPPMDGQATPGAANSWARGDHVHPTDTTRAPIDSPQFAGVPRVPTAAAATNTDQAASTAFVQQAIAGVVGGAPTALDTLKELADALGDNADYAAAITNQMATKASASDLSALQSEVTALESSAVQKNAAGRVLLGGATDNGNSQLQVLGEISQVNGSHVLYAYGSYQGYRSRSASGTSAAPTATTSGTAIGGLSLSGYNGGAYAETASFTAWAEEGFTASAMGTGWRLYTTPIGGTAQQERIRVGASGRVMLGTAIGADDGASTLQVGGSALFSGTVAHRAPVFLDSSVNTALPTDPASIYSYSCSMYSGGGGNGFFGNNTVRGTAGNTAIFQGGASYLQQGGGSFMFYAAASVAAGAVQSFVNTASLDASGNFSTGANVTGYSDERLKKNWRTLDAEFIERLAAVKCGVYDRTDIELTQVGVSAQSLRRVMPDAVLTGRDGMLSVAYGNAALTAVVMLARRLLELESRFGVRQ